MENELTSFVTAFSALCFWAGFTVRIIMWVGVKTHIMNPQSPRLQIWSAHWLAVAVAGFYSLLIFSPILGWVGNWSAGLGFVWLILANPIWLFLASLYLNRGYRIAMNNLH